MLMSKFGEPQPCRNNCGAYIYFDKDSEVGHPSADKWIPLVFEYDTGLRTNTAHQCPKSPYNKDKTQGQGQQQTSSSLYHVSDESVDRGISAFSMVTDLIRLAEQTQKLLVTMDDKLDRLLNLTFAQQQQQPTKQHQQNK